jgi:hypothetical protein
LAGAGMRRHLRAGHGAAESFVSCIRLFGGLAGPRVQSRLSGSLDQVRELKVPGGCRL